MLNVKCRRPAHELFPSIVLIPLFDFTPASGFVDNESLSHSYKQYDA